MTTTAPAPKTSVPTLTAPMLTMVTPEMAAEWLAAYNTDNRNMRYNLVDKIARDIQGSAWEVTGDSIKFDDQGLLIDGQHRLAAIKKANTTVPVFVIRGLANRVRNVIDTGAARSAGDVLRFTGRSNVSKLAAAVKIGMARRDGHPATVSDYSTKVDYTNTEVLEFLEANPAYDRLSPRANATYRAIKVKSTALWLYCLTELDYVDSEAALDFETALVEMRTSGLGDPRATLLRWLGDPKHEGIHSRVINVKTMFAIFRSWNAWRDGERIQKLVINEGAAIPDPH